ncbi:MAG: glutaredoxin family protein [Acidobacteriota bacterium]
MALPEIVVYSKPACCLCEKVKKQLTRLQKQHKFALREVNILEDATAYNRFKDKIPVIFVNGKKAFTYHLDEADFIKLLISDDCQQRESGTSAR